ncbi:MAG: hypothetical protein CL967_06080 [Euryarchaeota archaeon]|nr:hypothetical protein [Euryarchaeota archaeon]
MQADAARNKALEKIGEKLLKDGFNLTSLNNEELSAIAVQFTGDAPPDHIPRETVIEILSQQDSVKQWAMSVREKMAPKATEMATEQVRKHVDSIQAKVESKIQNDPMAAKIAEKFGDWLKDSGYTTVELTQMLDANKDGFITNDEATQFVQQISKSEPPQWVIDRLMDVMDSNDDGRLSVQEWWGFLESIGFEQPPPIDEFEDLEQELDDTPELTEAEARELVAQANLDAEQQALDNGDELRSMMSSSSSLEPSSSILPSYEQQHASSNSEEAVEIPSKIVLDFEFKDIPSKKKILLTIPANVTVGASDDQQIQENGKKALSGQSTVEIEQMAREIVSEEFTLAISMITIEDINRNKKWFLDHCTDIIDKKLNTIGLQVLDIDVIDITDSAGVIEEMGAKAVAEHTAQHETGPVDINTISWEIENSTELMIEKLEQSRLSSEADAIIADCYEHLCALKVEQIDRTLVADGEYRGGYTIVGEIDGGPFSAGVMFPADANDTILSLKTGIMINCVGQIVKWSSGRRLALLKGRDPVLR